MPKYASLPGFRDFYPDEFAVRQHIASAWREVARRHGFAEYDGPPLEPLELYVEKSGAEIVDQLYSFEDKGGRAVALRPEMTPSLARMVGARAAALRKPIRWFSIPQLFRYERTQRGRLREHFQWNVDVLGEASIAADVEVLAVALDALRELGLTEADVVARYNDRRLLERLLLGLGVTDAGLGAVYSAVDRLSRESVERVRERLLRDAGLSARVSDSVLGIFRRDGLDALEAEFRSLTGGEIFATLRSYREQLEDLGLGGYLRFDSTIVRGLAYYTGTVFEIFDRTGELRAICGGGRYDQLLRSLSESDLPAVGFGMGDVVLAELLAERGLLRLPEHPLDYYVVVVAEAQRSLQRRLAQALRAQGHAVSYALRDMTVGKQFREADAQGARQVIVLGPDEVAAGRVVLREMATGEEQRVPLESLLGGP